MNIFNLTENYHPLELESILKIDRALMESCDNLRIIQVFLEHLFYTRNHPSRLKHHLFNEVAHCSLVYQYINQVPVFLVSKELVGKTFDFNFVGHHLKFTVPNDNLPTEDLNGDVESILGKDLKREEVALEMPAEAGIENKGKDYEPFVPVANIDLWGLYIGARQPIHNLRNAHPMIFIWVDKIHDYVKSEYEGKSHYYNLFTSQVILHEMMHALMDINILAPDHENNINIPEWFRLMKEESLAEAGSLMLMDGIWKKRDIEFLLEHISDPGRPSQYRLGSFYFKAGSGVVERAIENWLGRYYNQKLAEDWLRYIKGAFPKTDADQLNLYEKGFSISKFVYKYKGCLYDNNDLPKTIIRDYTENHPTLKSDLMKVFPDTLNRWYEAFIDPQIKDHFTGKRSSNTLQIYENHKVKCIDGELVVCNYWHPDDTILFVKHARDLGFVIIDFWKNNTLPL